MKKIVALLLAVAMLATLGLSSFAATKDIVGDGEGISEETTAVENYNKADVYTTEGTEWWVVKIPTEGVLTWGQDGSANMSYTVGSQLAEGKGLKVTVAASDTALKPDNGGTGSIAYTGTGIGGDGQTFGAINGTGTSAADATGLTSSSAVSVAVEASAFAGQPIGVYRVTLTYTVEVTGA